MTFSDIRQNIWLSNGANFTRRDWIVSNASKLLTSQYFAINIFDSVFQEYVHASFSGWSGSPYQLEEH